MIRRFAAVVLAVAFGVIATAAPATADTDQPLGVLGNLHCC